MMNLSNAVYLSQLKWKAGERRALATARSARSGRMIPAFKIPPAGGFDPEQQKVLTTTEYLRSFGKQLADCWDRRIAFIDAALIDDEHHREAIGGHPLTELLERARLAGGNAAPIFSSGNSDDYKAAVRRFLGRNDSPPSCLRLKIDEMENLEGPEALRVIAADFGANPSSTVILLDGGPLAIHEVNEFADILAGQIARLIAPNTWMRVFWSATSFPEQPKLKAGMDGSFPRLDWQLYRALMEHAGSLPVTPMFSDYALEYPSAYAPFNGAPSAHLRYSSVDEYFIFKGPSVRREQGYKAIFEVAERLVSSDAYAGADYSLGNAFIDRLATGIGKTGHASMWRWSSTDHHFSLVIEQLAEMFKLPKVSVRVSEPMEQLALL
ncbi:beta family protein [Sphingobium estronivorans]|uniref:beta family protein n=1 Tax=Sphingobium estronivorans TaxID=1577690 RepID=UPI001239AE9F|nr:hypothetical protein [Sphingobium estronivorans]